MASPSAHRLSLGLVILFQAGIFLFVLPSITAADDVSRAAPNGGSATCGNDFRLVMVSISLSLCYTFFFGMVVDGHYFHYCSICMFSFFYFFPSRSTLLKNTLVIDSGC